MAVLAMVLLLVRAAWASHSAQLWADRSCFISANGRPFAAALLARHHGAHLIRPSTHAGNKLLSAGWFRGTAGLVAITGESIARRQVLRGFADAVAASSYLQSAAAVVAANDETQEIYIGAGCFWHVQHETVIAEKTLLGREKLFTSVVGYAGGKKVGADNKVCYHNVAHDSDYGMLGHAEVVSVRVPAREVAAFAARALDELWDAKGRRADPQDRGGEYRSALGLPGGLAHPAMALLRQHAAAKGLSLVAGVGDEGDALEEKLIYVYDTQVFPFHAGELYHQYHNDMVGTYGKEYARLRQSALDQGTIALSQCPDSASDTPLEALNTWAKDAYADWKRKRSR